MPLSRWRPADNEDDVDTSKHPWRRQVQRHAVCPSNSRPPARLSIFDRTSATLEEFVDEVAAIASFSKFTYIENNNDNTRTNWYASEPPLVLDQPTIFRGHRLADRGSAAWAFRFQLDKWFTTYDIQEVYLENFGSFLQLESPPMAESDDSGPERESKRSFRSFGWQFTAPSGASSPAIPILMSTRRERRRLNSRSPISSTTSGYASSLSLPPKTREVMHVEDELWTEMADLSAGRTERLAQHLLTLPELRLVFRDEAVLARRPALFIFAFINRVSARLHSLTLDMIRCTMNDPLLPIDEVFHIPDHKNLTSLIIRQPSIDEPALLVRDELIYDFLKSLPVRGVESMSTKVLSMRLLGRTHLTAKALAFFVKSWCLHPQVLLFGTLSVEGHGRPLAREFERLARGSRAVGIGVRKNVPRLSLDEGPDVDPEVGLDGEELSHASPADGTHIAFHHKFVPDVRLDYRHCHGDLSFTFVDTTTWISRPTRLERLVARLF